MITPPCLSRPSITHKLHGIPTASTSESVECRLPQTHQRSFRALPGRCLADERAPGAAPESVINRGCRMSEYTLPHDLTGERQRLQLMSELLDPVHRSHLERLGVRPGWRCLEVGCGNGSISQWLATRIAPGGHVVASDVDLRYLDQLYAPDLEVRRLDIVRDNLEEDAYDLVTARAVLHHLPDREEAVRRMIAAL